MAFAMPLSPTLASQVRRHERPKAIPSSASDTRLVATIKGVIARRRGAAYGSLKITDDQAEELARGIATVLTLPPITGADS